jgi:hypothetical protein
LLGQWGAPANISLVIQNPLIDIRSEVKDLAGVA